MSRCKYEKNNITCFDNVNDFKLYFLIIHDFDENLSNEFDELMIDTFEINTLQRKYNFCCENDKLFIYDMFENDVTIYNIINNHLSFDKILQFKNFDDFLKNFKKCIAK